LFTVMTSTVLGYATTQAIRKRFEARAQFVNAEPLATESEQRPAQNTPIDFRQ
jgi:hypothetical protein